MGKAEAVRPRHAGNYTRWIPIGSTLRASGGHFFESLVWRGSTGDRQKRARWPPYAPFSSDYVVEALVPHPCRAIGPAFSLLSERQEGAEEQEYDYARSDHHHHPQKAQGPSHIVVIVEGPLCELVHEAVGDEP